MGEASGAGQATAALDRSLLAGVGHNGHAVARRVDARRSRAGALSNAVAQTHVGSGRSRRMNKPVLDHIGIAVKSIEAAKIYEALGLTIDHVEVVETQKVKTAF